MKNSIHILREWNKQIDSYYKLNLDEAKKLYIEMINSSDDEKEVYRDSLIKGIYTLV